MESNSDSESVEPKHRVHYIHFYCDIFGCWFRHALPYCVGECINPIAYYILLDLVYLFLIPFSAIHDGRFYIVFLQEDMNMIVRLWPLLQNKSPWFFNCLIQALR